ncbi:ABC transporter substrate-binding protein [Oribacterium sp. P6A1]|uniref:ABC transporter substrate-binding protein n=1 Tax=Oribacterium sp. P6A1 TaxID=1410612 RepID=UPI00055D92C0|nr:ABC transporter substrate-binding protein [Oribacterium sp. P6A1]
MKKTLAVLMAAAITAASIAGCGGSSSSGNTSGSAETTKAQESQAQETKAAEETKAESEAADSSDDLLEAAKAEGELTVYGSCEEEYLAAACKNFEKLYGIKVQYQRLSTSEVYTKIKEEGGNPSGDVWFGGTTDPYNEAVKDGLLEQYDAKNAVNLIGDQYKDPTNCWYGIYKGILGFMVNNEELQRLGLEAPKSWDDLTKEEYKGLIMLSNPNTAGTAKLVINTMVQMKGHDEAMEYFKKLDKNITQYTKSGSGPSKMVGPGECVIGIGFLHDGIYQILQGYDNIGLVVPSDGTSYEIGATAIFKGAKHPNAAKLWIEYALSPDCVNLAKDNGSYQFLVLSNAEQPKEATEFGLDMNNTIDYDFEDAKANTEKYIEDFFEALGSTADSADSGRFLTE